MTRVFVVVAAMAFLCCQTGCATLFTGDRETIQVSSVTPGALVTVNGSPYGQTPTSVSVDKTENQTIVVTTPDGRSFTCTANSSVGVGWVILDIVAGLIPVLVDAATGKWKSLDTNICHAPL